MVSLSKLSQFGNSFQVKVIGRLLTSKEFLVNVADGLLPEYFENKAHEWIISEVLQYFRSYHTHPSIDKMNVEVKKIDNEILRISINEQLREAYRMSDSSPDLLWVETEFQNFCVNQQVKKAIITSVDLLEIGDYDGIKQLVNNAMKVGQNKNIGHVYDKDIESRYREEDRGPIPYPWKTFNDITDGGYGKGELILVFGNPKGGKSWATIAMAAHAASMGYNIVYYTLELSEGYVGKRMDAYLTGVEVGDLKNHRDKVNKIFTKLKGRVIIKEFAAGKATLDNLEAHLQQLENQEDFKPDAIFIDYLDLMKNRNVRREKKDDVDDIYVDARGLAREKQVPLISPSQTNRAGANDDIIQADKIAGSYNKIMIGDFVVSLSRKRKDKLNGTGRWHIMGNRFGPDGLSYFSKINTSNGHIEINEKPLEDDSIEFEDPKVNDASGVSKDDKQFIKGSWFKLVEEE